MYNCRLDDETRDDVTRMFAMKANKKLIQQYVRETTRLAKSKGSTKGGMVQYVAHGQNKVDGVTKPETMVTYWIAHHNLPMSAADEFSRMVPKLFPDSKIAKMLKKFPIDSLLLKNLHILCPTDKLDHSARTGRWL